MDNSNCNCSPPINEALESSPSLLNISTNRNQNKMVYVYLFNEGNKTMKEILGGKGANLAEMTNLGLPVPPGFTITTEVCKYFADNGKHPEGLEEQLNTKLNQIEEQTGKIFGDRVNPLLVSVRSGAAISMPGMMDTVLNLGLNDTTILGLIEKTQNERFCYDAYRRFVNMFGNVVMGVDHELFEEKLEAIKEDKGVKLDTELDTEDLKRVVQAYKNLIREKTGKDFPDDPMTQLKDSIDAVFKSWNNPRAITYRKINNIKGLIGTAVNVQTMVFGNMGETSGTGVAFTRNPSTGAKEFYGEYLMNAQGEDVVAGIRTPQKLETLGTQMPELYDQLVKIKERLEAHYQDMQDLEFTIETGTLYILQTRNGKRTAQAAVKIACDMVDEKLIDEKTAVLRVEADKLTQLLHPYIDPNAEKHVIAKGLPASPGACSGKVVFSADDAYDWANDRDEKVILVRKETSPEDIHGMHAAQGILTSTGGMTSHAAVVARGMGKCCVAGCADVIVDKKHRKIMVGDYEVKEGEVITLNGSTGEVILGEVEMCRPELTGDFKRIMDWADQYRKLKVRTNADTPQDSKVAREFGAEGIGLCRTEHMFFEEDRIPMMREMILANDEEGRKKALEKLLPLQQKDFEEIFEVMSGYPVTIRLLDPPLHEFLPDKDKKIEALAQSLGITFEELKNKIVSLHEVNPMLGHRGCRLGITYPEIYKMQVKAILQAGITVANKGLEPIPEIEVPLVSTVHEFMQVKSCVQEVIEEFGERINFKYYFGTMIELPRACMRAHKIANQAEFFSFGTNDLTQTTYGISRDDVGKFIPFYLENGLFDRDPFESLDQRGVGELMKLCVSLARQSKPDLPIGICGEQGGEPESVEFCHNIGLNFVSCSPYRVPIARLAAAQAAIKAEE